MNISQTGLDSLKRSEGVVPVMYRDVAGLPTIGIGHLLTKSELSSGKLLIAGILTPWTPALTMAQVDDLLRQDLQATEKQVLLAVHVALSQPQFDALVSFTFNVGGTAFARSKLVQKLNAGDYAGVPEQLRRWVYAAGKPQEGLRKRREEEVRLWNGDA